MNSVIIFDFNRTLYDPDKAALVPAALEVLDDAKAKKYVLVLLSKAAEGRRMQIEQLGIAGYFAESILVTAKTDEMFADIATRYAADMRRSFVIGDRAQGELAFGSRGGWRTIWVRGGKFADELPEPGQKIDHVVTKLAEVAELI